MLTRMVSISQPRDLPASASQSAGITGLSHSAWPSYLILLEIYLFTYMVVISILDLVILFPAFHVLVYMHVFVVAIDTIT